MNVEFRKSFEKDLGSIRDVTLLQRIRAVIEEVETAENLGEVKNIKKLKDWCQLKVKPPVRQGLKPLPHSPSPLKRTNEFNSPLERTLAISRGLKSLAVFSLS
jgi:hypothetical protein